MTTASYQDIDSFIQFQKEKLIRDKNSASLGSNYPNPSHISQLHSQSQQIDYNRQLNDYLNLPRRPSVDDSLQNRQSESSQFINQPTSSEPLQKIQNKNNNHFTKKEDSNFFNKFGKKYEAQKSKLKNDLQQEYKQFMEKKKSNEKNRKNGEKISEEFYATLPLKGMEGNKEKIKTELIYDFELLQNKLKNNYNKKQFGKGQNDPDIKPYSKYSGSQDNLYTNPSLNNDSRSRSNYDINADEHHFQNNFQQQPFDQNYNAFRTRSANSYENMINGHPESYVAGPLPTSAIDPSLANILRRPPVGLKTPLPQFQPSGRVQFNDSVQYSRYSPPLSVPHQQSIQSQHYYPNNSNLNNIPKNQTLIHNPTTVAKDSVFNFSEDQNKDIKAIKAREYQEELQRQVREKQLKKQKEKEEQEKIDKKFLHEAVVYNPYGRSGGGAPIKDREGNIVADLKNVRADPEQYSPRSLSQPPPSTFNQPYLPTSNNFHNNYNQYNNQNDTSNYNQQLNTNRSQKQSSDDGGNFFSRGGNGIFGEGKSEEQKKQEEKYKADLQKQIEEKQRLKALEKEKLRIEEEKEQKRIEEQQKRIKAELEEEERKKKAKEEQGKRIADDAKKLADEKRKQEANKKASNIKSLNKRQQANKVGTNISNNEESLPMTPQPQFKPDFRTNSPPVPAAAKKLNGVKPTQPSSSFNNKVKQPVTDTTADYYVTESRLNLRDINKSPKSPPSLIQERTPSDLINNFENTNSPRNSRVKEGFIPNKPIIKKSISNRPPSQSSNSEVLNQLQNLKKHLYNEQIQIESELQNSNNRVTIGELADLHHNILNVRTPPESSFQRTYRKDFETPPLNGGLEPRTYFRENTVLLGDPKQYNDNLFSNHLEREANERQINRLSMLQDDALTRPYEIDQIATRNQQRLKKLRELEGDNFSLADPNEVLNKFLNKNNRAPSTTTLNDDTWLKNPS